MGVCKRSNHKAKVCKFAEHKLSYFGLTVNVGVFAKITTNLVKRLNWLLFHESGKPLEPE
jgi:hypothetical protein